MKKRSDDKSTYPSDLSDHIFYGLNLDKDQIKLREAIWDEDNIITVCDSKAGTGKTTIALATALLLVQYGRYDGIYYIVSPSMEEKQGYLPGDQESKSAPYMEPLIDALLTLGEDPNKLLISESNFEAVKNGTACIKFMTHTYLRGTNFENKVVVIDEAQNFYFDELKKVLTRIHDNCKTILIGHTKQCDLYKNPERSGFCHYLKAFENIKDDKRADIIHLTINHRGWLSQFCDDVEY